MNEEEIRSLPTDKLLELKDKLNKEKSEINMTDEDRLSKLEAAVAALIDKFKAEDGDEVDEEEAGEEPIEEEARAVPVTEVAEDDVEDDTESAAKYDKLEAKLAELQTLIATNGAITPDTPEDEPTMNGPKVPPVSSGPIKSKDRDINVPKTPAMKARVKAGKNTGIPSSTFNAKDVKSVDAEELAIDEVFSFAANRGLVPLARSALGRIKI